jgi:hypothetical protein
MELLSQQEEKHITNIIHDERQLHKLTRSELVDEICRISLEKIPLDHIVLLAEQRLDFRQIVVDIWNRLSPDTQMIKTISESDDKCKTGLLLISSPIIRLIAELHPFDTIIDKITGSGIILDKFLEYLPKNLQLLICACGRLTNHPDFINRDDEIPYSILLLAQLLISL